MNSEALAIIEKLEEATKAAFALARSSVVAQGDDDQWTRLPASDGRCPVSRFSRSKVNRLIAAGKVRAKTVQGAKFYAAADMRRLLTD